MAAVPQGLRITDELSVPPGASKHIRPDPLTAGLFEMMGTAGSVAAPHDPPNQGEVIPTLPPLQHKPNPAYPLQLHDPPLGNDANAVPANPALYPVVVDEHPSVDGTTCAFEGTAAASAAANRSNRTMLRG